MTTPPTVVVGTTTVKTAKPSLLGRFKVNAMSYSYGQVVSILVQLALVPFFLKYWGTARYADWLVLSGIPTMLILLDFGVAQASNNKAVMLAGRGDWQGVACCLQTSLVFTLTLGLSIVSIVGIFNMIVDWRSLLKLKALASPDAAQVMMLLSLNLAIQLLGGPLDGWFRSIDRTALGAFAIANRRMADLIITVIVLSLSGDPVRLAMVVLAVQICLLVVLVLLASSLSHHKILGFSLASFHEFKDILKPAIAYMSFPLSQTITLQGGLQLLNQLSNASTVVGFSMARTLMRLILQFGVVANNALKPEISRLAGQGDLVYARRETLKVTAAVIAVSIVGYILAVFAGPFFVTWWGHNKIAVSSSTLALVGLHAILNVGWFVPAALLIATNTHEDVAIWYGVSSTLSFLVWYILSGHIAPIVGASMLLAVPEATVLTRFYTGKIINKNNSSIGGAIDA